MHEILLNLHMHTFYSDGHGSHREIANAAIRSNLDAVIVTDHNVWVNGPEGYYQDGQEKVLMLIGEEVHDPTRTPQKNHLLVFGADRELAGLAGSPQALIDGVNGAGGLSFLAHPYDPASKTFNEPDITWNDWEIDGYTGIELWNGLSEFKSLLKTRFHAIFYSLMPNRIPHGPPVKLLKRWDELLTSGKKVVAVGGSDAHQLPANLGPIHKVVFPYNYHFRMINTHLLIPHALTGNVEADKEVILKALQKGYGFVGNDGIESTRGFRFQAHGKEIQTIMGGDIPLNEGVTFQIRLPAKAECNLVQNGKIVKSWVDRDVMVFNARKTGVYRVEAYRRHLGKRRGWIFSNPIYINN